MIKIDQKGSKYTVREELDSQLRGFVLLLLIAAGISQIVATIVFGKLSAPVGWCVAFIVALYYLSSFERTSLTIDVQDRSILVKHRTLFASNQKVFLFNELNSPITCDKPSSQRLYARTGMLTATFRDGTVVTINDDSSLANMEGVVGTLNGLIYDKELPS